MSKKQAGPTAEVLTTAPQGFQPGHPKLGGRKKRWGGIARALMEELGEGADPIRFMLSLVKSDVIDQTVIEDGKRKRVQVTVPLDVRLDAAKTVANYIYPRLSSQEISGPEGGPIPATHLDVTAILANPQLAAAAQELALMVAEREAEAADGPAEYPVYHPLRLPPSAKQD
jgi:hypothetical protein